MQLYENFIIWLEGYLKALENANEKETPHLDCLREQVTAFRKMQLEHKEEFYVRGINLPPSSS